MVLQTVKLEAGHADEYAMNRVQRIVLSTALENPTVDPLEAEKLYHIWIAGQKAYRDEEP